MDHLSELQGPDCTLANVISPWAEMLAWETLWGVRNQTQKTLSELFRTVSARLPSEVLARARSQALWDEIGELEQTVSAYLTALTSQFSICVRGTFHYPERLQEARYPVELFYYRGEIGLLERPCVSIVGARQCSNDGRRRAARISRELCDAGVTIVSGLAAGIDTAAMEAAIEAKGHTVGVIGTPVNQSYPKENAGLQEEVATDHLLVSQVPFYRYATEPFANKKFYFPQRNETMAALSMATVIIEASETSGTHTQARACLQRGRRLFILNSCFEQGLKWPSAYERQGAVRVRNIEDVLSALKGEADGDGSRRTTLEEDGMA